jgi:crossover junction endodeoxyribonuclease RusA
VIVAFSVWGVPAPKGSYRAYTYRRAAAKGGGLGARVDHDNQRTRAWQRDVARAAQLALREHAAPVRVRGRPVLVSLHCYLPRPQKFARPRHAHAPHVTKPDLDKLQRAILDGLKGVAFVDDAQVDQIAATKQYVELGARPRVDVSIHYDVSIHHGV